MRYLALRVLVCALTLSVTGSSQEGRTSRPAFAAEGQFDVGSKGKLQFRPRKGGAPLDIDEASAVKTTMVGIPHVVTGHLESDGRLVVHTAGNAIVNEWDKAVATTTAGAQKALYRKVEDLKVFLASAKAGTAQPKTYFLKLDEIEREIGRSLLDNPASADAERAALVRFARLLLEEKRQGKAFYGSWDTFRPLTYDRIFARSRGCGALAERGDRVVASCTLIGENLVLTCRHCIARYVPTELEVRFNYEEDLSGKYIAPVKVYPVVQFAAVGTKLDYAVLKLGPGADTRAVHDDWPIQTQTLRRVKLDDAIYVVGHPLGRPRIVADNAYVMFPFEVTQDERERMRVRIEVQHAGNPRLATVVASFLDSYRKGEDQPLYRNYSTRWGGMPTIGADCDTSVGNSGSPVFSKTAHQVVGVLFDGEDDLGKPWESGWLRHEAIVPITEIVADLRKNNPELLKQGMQIDG